MAARPDQQVFDLSAAARRVTAALDQLDRTAPLSTAYSLLPAAPASQPAPVVSSGALVRSDAAQNRKGIRSVPLAGSSSASSSSSVSPLPSRSVGGRRQFVCTPSPVAPSAASTAGLSSSSPPDLSQVPDTPATSSTEADSDDAGSESYRDSNRASSSRSNSSAAQDDSAGEAAAVASSVGTDSGASASFLAAGQRTNAAATREALPANCVTENSDQMQYCTHGVAGGRGAYNHRTNRYFNNDVWLHYSLFWFISRPRRKAALVTIIRDSGLTFSTRQTVVRLLEAYFNHTASASSNELERLAKVATRFIREHPGTPSFPDMRNLTRESVVAEFQDLVLRKLPDPPAARPHAGSNSTAATAAPSSTTAAAAAATTATAGGVARSSASSGLNTVRPAGVFGSGDLVFPSRIQGAAPIARENSVYVTAHCRPFFQPIVGFADPLVSPCVLEKVRTPKVTYFFRIPQRVKSTLDQVGGMVQLRFFPGVSKLYSPFAPGALSLTINNRSVNLNNLRADTQLYLDITPYLQFGDRDNRVCFMLSSYTTVVPVMQALVPMPPDRLAKRLVDAHKTRTWVECMADMKRSFRTSAQDGLEETARQVSLRCPLGGTRIKVPVVGKQCKHNASPFDLENFLSMNERVPKWRCPVCDKPASYADLRPIDYMIHVLSDARSKDASEIEIAPGGTWKVSGAASGIKRVRDAPGSSGPAVVTITACGMILDSDPPKKRQRAAPPPPAARDVVDLTLDDDDDDDEINGAAIDGLPPRSSLPVVPPGAGAGADAGRRANATSGGVGFQASQQQQQQQLLQAPQARTRQSASPAPQSAFNSTAALDRLDLILGTYGQQNGSLPLLPQSTTATATTTSSSSATTTSTTAFARGVGTTPPAASTASRRTTPGATSASRRRSIDGAALTDMQADSVIGWAGGYHDMLRSSEGAYHGPSVFDTPVPGRPPGHPPRGRRR